MEFDKYSHSLGESNFHFQFTPKYRRDIFRDVIIKKACEESFLRIAVKYKMVVRALEFGPDHVHLFLRNCKKYSVPQVAQYFKGASSRELRKKYMDRVKIRLWGDSFWSDGYFYESVGRVTSESVEYYIKRQQGETLGRRRFRSTEEKSIAEIFKGLFLRLTETTINAQGFQP